MREWKITFTVEDDESRSVEDIRETISAFTSICVTSIDEERGLYVPSTLSITQEA